LSSFFQHLLRLLLHLGYLGPFLMGVMDSSFLFLPIGNDLLVIILAARHHSQAWIYVLSATVGSTTGALLLDLVCRKIGEAGVQKVTGEQRFTNLKNKVGERGGFFVALACLGPPPFPFTAIVATVSALAYPRLKLLAIVAASRLLRFIILSLLAIKYGRAILRIINTPAFKWSVGTVAGICLVVSAFSLLKWVRAGRSGRPAPAQAAA
jgi:membrane protein YqaA with SNARE-associated domain